ncbi:hypothetical protein POSPLADRAFT_1064586 [Postia placenta MAD-698-R-SB12]|uniref:RPA43 OB domain-containing protein n=1 Tax=Postia placenta MAD-698-R-SB12 TaxID=670580 RepID=A0A1X6NBS3_9APHY|nr:hypothetical protein POSPLADRAFT_1064586 [Postia placenta MAD-698-R-SB12]OSX66089.1 hypothetical protein POSPLADRAFT_1064586 [Postia placenta MAD-698-R-SB12]
MSQSIDKKAKKRKHASADIGQGVEPSTKRAKKDKAEKGNKVKSSSKLDKGKARATDGGNEFRVVQASMVVSIPPVFANNLQAGVEDMLDSLLMRYIPALQGVVLAHDNLRFLDSVATVKADCPFTNCRIAFDATVWSPQAGMKLVGKVKLCSPDHVALLVHRTFNVSIPRHHIPTEQWEFEYGPAENDPEFGTDTAAEEMEMQLDPESAADTGLEGTGRWVHKLTGTKLGSSDGYLEFTVVGLTIANQMLSLVGSIQLDPFSPKHIPTHSTPTTSDPQAAARTSGPAEITENLQELGLDEDVDSEEDTFGMLGRMGDEAAAREAERRAQEEGAAKKDKKRKRKEAKTQAEGELGAASSHGKAKKKKS